MSTYDSSLEQPERRAHVRYPVKLALCFMIQSGKIHTVSGKGTTVNISSTGMLFRSAKHLEGGDKVVAAVQWPTAERNPLILLFQGHVVWMKGLQVGITVSHYGFLPNDMPELDDLEKLSTLAAPRHLTPTRTTTYVPGSVRQWKKSEPHWKQ